MNATIDYRKARQLLGGLFESGSRGYVDNEEFDLLAACTISVIVICQAL